MNPNTMTLDECRQWLYDSHGPSRDNFVDEMYPPTLDGAAGSMPDGWYYWINHCALNGQEVFECRAVNKQICTRSAEANAPTEILARYRLACAVRIAQKEQA